jgi:alkylhydroperoxidase family enzyme
MTWVPITADGRSERAAVLGMHPGAYAAHQAFLEACDGIFDPGLVTLCRARMAQMLHCREELARHPGQTLTGLESWWERPEDYSALQRNALSFAEQFIMDPALISPELAAGLERDLGTSGTLNFATVISAIEASLRLSALLDLDPAE